MVSNGQKLHGFRKQNNLSRKDVATVIGRSVRTLSYYESGQLEMPSSIVERLNKQYSLKLTMPKKSKSSSSSKSSSKSSKVVSRVSSSSKSSKNSKTSSIMVDVSTFKSVLKQVLDPLSKLLDMIDNK